MLNSRHTRCDGNSGCQFIMPYSFRINSLFPLCLCVSKNYKGLNDIMTNDIMNGAEAEISEPAD